MINRDPIFVLRQRCTGHGNLTKFAEQIGVTPAFVSAVLSGRKRPTKKMLEALGLEHVRIDVYRVKFPKESAA